MNFIILFICVPLVHSASHSFKTTYSRLNGQTLAGIPQMYSLSTLDGRQIDYYDNDTGKVIPSEDWMKEFASGDKWKKYTESRERVQKTNNQFIQSHGVYMYERVYGCVWDDQTEDSHGFDEYSYDGKPFISLDLNESRYTARVQKAEPTVLKWNSDTEQLDFLKQYYQHDCIYWLKELLNLSTVKKTVTDSEQLQKNQTEEDTERNGSASDDLTITLPVASIIIIVLAGIGLTVLLCKQGNKLKAYCKYQLVESFNSTQETPV